MASDDRAVGETYWDNLDFCFFVNTGKGKNQFALFEIRIEVNVCLLCLFFYLTSISLPFFPKALG